MNNLALLMVLHLVPAWGLETPVENPADLQCNLATVESQDPLYRLRLEQGTADWVSLLWRPETLRLSPRSTAPSSDLVLDTARGYLGTPYVWGGVGRRGLDCSGFVNAVYAKHGYDLPRVSRDQFRVGVKTPRSRLAPGDLLFFVTTPGTKKITHVGMYVGDDEFIHAVFHAIGDDGRLRNACDQDNPGLNAHSSHLRQGGQAVHPRHHHIEKNQLGFIGT